MLSSLTGSSKTKGATMVELIVALGILALGITALLQTLG
jgi:type II secretory pathway pseudopilin PulG